MRLMQNASLTTIVTSSLVIVLGIAIFEPAIPGC